MAPVPKKKHTHGRTRRRRGKKALTLKKFLSQYSRAKGIEKKLAKNS